MTERWMRWIQRWMLCPYCQRTFTITEDEQYENETFECPHCHKANAGCSSGVLTGVTQLDFDLSEIMREKGKSGTGRNNETDLL